MAGRVGWGIIDFDLCHKSLFIDMSGAHLRWAFFLLTVFGNKKVCLKVKIFASFLKLSKLNANIIFFYIVK